MDDFCAAEYLEGLELPNGWKVVSRISPSATGGKFGISYLVERQKGTKIQHAFLKALSLRRLSGEPDFARALEQHVAAFNFERDTLEICKSRHMRRVAQVLDAGQHKLPKQSIPVCYIIFELAEVGDVRKHLSLLKQLDLAWTLRTLHQVAVGMKQLHTHGIAHQDVKPSNILLFEAFGAKIGDLGCADLKKTPSKSPRGAFRFAGDPSYAPPELFYSEVSLDWSVRRLGCDLYLLGSLIVFFFTGGASMTALLRKKIATQHSPSTWPHDYRTVLPYVRNAFEEALEELEPSIPESVRSNLMQLIRCLCDPDPKRRGFLDMPSAQFDLQRIVSKFDLLASKAEHGLLPAKNGS
jgi:serine/threonine protein kinase